MSINLQVFEDTGAISSGRGTTVTEITNINWKNSGDVTDAYYYYPLRRPVLDRDQTLSYKKFIFFKISGTYTFIKDIKLTVSVVSAAQAHNTELFYKWTNTYEVPTANYDGAMMKADDSFILCPMLSTVGPNSAGSLVITAAANQTLYTPYLCTQMRVNKSTWDDVGNTAQLKFNLSLHEFE